MQVVVTPSVLRTSYGMSSTEIVPYDVQYRDASCGCSALRIRDAMSGTDVVAAANSLRRRLGDDEASGHIKGVVERAQGGQINPFNPQSRYNSYRGRGFLRLISPWRYASTGHAIVSSYPHTRVLRHVRHAPRTHTPLLSCYAPLREKKTGGKKPRP